MAAGYPRRFDIRRVKMEIKLLIFFRFAKLYCENNIQEWLTVAMHKCHFNILAGERKKIIWRRSENEWNR